MWTAIELGWRAIRSRASWARSAVLAFVGILACGSLLVVLMGAGVKQREGDRYQRVFEQGASVTGDAVGVQADYESREITIVAVRSGRRVALPGLDAPLAAGEMRLSPALSSRVRSDPVLARWFPYRQLADLPVEAVGSAGEYKAYVGLEPRRIREATFSQPLTTLNYDASFGYFQWFGFLMFVGAPAIGLLLMSARFGRRRRRERYGALRLLGMPDSACRVVLGMETGVPIAVGAALAGVAALAIKPDRLMLPLVGRWIFGVDAHLSPVAVVAVVTLVAIGGAAIGLTTPRQRVSGRVRDLVARADGAQPWIALAYLTGVGFACWSLALGQPRDPRRLVAALLVAVALPNAVAVGSAMLARFAAWRDAPVVWYVGMRKMAADPRSSTRVAGIVAIVVFVAGIAEPIVQVVAAPGASWEEEVQKDGISSVVGRAYSEAGAPLRVVAAAPPGTSVAVREVGLWTRGVRPPAPPTGRAVIASCSDLSLLAGVPIEGCGRSVQWLASASQPTTPDQLSSDRLVMRSPNGAIVARLPKPESTVVLPEIGAVDDVDEYLAGAVLVPPRLVRSDDAPFATGLFFRTDATSLAWRSAQAWIMSGSPLYVVFSEYGVYPGDNTGAWILLGLTFAAGLAFVGAALSAVDDRRSAGEWAALRAVGMEQRDLIWLRMTSALVSSLVAMMLAIGPSLLIAHAWLRVNDDALTTYMPFVRSVVLATLSIHLVTLLSAYAQVRRVGVRS